ncbi:MAG: response regulator [Leadbetterella sp.]
MRKPRILIIDDHLLFSGGIAAYLSEKYEVITHKDALSSLEKVAEYAPDLVLLDFNMPNLNGIDLSKMLFESYPDLKTIFISMSEDKFTVDKFYIAGAKGFVSKTADMESFENAIKIVLDGGVYFPFDKNVDSSTSSNKNNRLTKREIEIAEKVKEGLTTKEIAEVLHISYFTAETHRKNIIVKLGLKGEKELYKYLVKGE